VEINSNDRIDFQPVDTSNYLELYFMRDFTLSTKIN